MHRCAAIKAAARTEPEARAGWIKKGRAGVGWGGGQAQKEAGWGPSAWEESWEEPYARSPGGQCGRHVSSGRHQVLDGDLSPKRAAVLGPVYSLVGVGARGQ